MMMKLKKEWNDVEKTSKELINIFRLWHISNLKILNGKDKTIERTFGFPYTSSSAFAGIWNCNADAVYKWSTDWSFDGIAVSEINDAVAVFSKELDCMYIIIGKVDD